MLSAAPAWLRTGLVVLAFGVVVLVGVGAVAVAVLRPRVDREFRGMARALLDAAAPEAGDRTVQGTDLDALPEPIARWIRRVAPIGTPVRRTVHYRQRAEMRLQEGPAAPWLPLDADHRVTTDPPGFVWDATIRMASVVPTRVVDAYLEGEGRLHARLLGAIPLVDQRGGRTDEGELLRWLAETPWYPTAVLPGGPVRWEPVDDREARATVDHGGTSVTMTFAVDEVGRVETVRAESRPRSDTESAPWVGRFSAYEARGPVEVPTGAEVSWVVDGAEVPYWRLRELELVESG